jgi:hypothetical protein
MDTAEKVALDVETSRSNTEAEVYGFNEERRNWMTQSRLNKKKGWNALGTGVLNAAGTTALNFWGSPYSTRTIR